MQIFRELLKHKEKLINSSHIFLNKGINAIVPIFFIPYYNKVFGVQGYGELVYVQTATILLQFLTDYGFHITGIRDLSHYGIDLNHQSRKVSAIYFAKVILAVISYGILFTIVFSLGFSFDKSLLYILSYTSFLFYSFTPYWFFQGVRENSTITKINLLSKVALVILVLTFIHSDSPLYYVPIVEGLGNFIACLLSIIVLIKSHKISFTIPRWGSISEQLLQGKDVFFSAVSNWVMTAGAILVLGYYADPKGLGYFATFTRLLYYAYAVLQPISISIFPYISEKFSISYAAGILLIKKLLNYYLLLVGLFITICFIAARYIFSLFFDSFFLDELPAYMNVFYILTVWTALILVNYFIGVQCLVACGKDKIYSRYYFVNAVCTVTCMFILIPKYLLIGASLSLVIGEFVMVLLLLKSYYNTINTLHVEKR